MWGGHGKWLSGRKHAVGMWQGFVIALLTTRLALPHARHSSTSASPMTYTCAKPSTYTPLPPRLTSSRICNPLARFADPSGLQSVVAGRNKSRTTCNRAAEAEADTLLVDPGAVRARALAGGITCTVHLMPRAAACNYTP